MKWYICAIAALVLLLAGEASAQSVWYKIQSSGAATAPAWGGAPTRFEPGSAYRTTLTGATSIYVFVGDCALGSSFDAVNLAGAGTTVNFQRCSYDGCSNPITVLSTPLADGASLILNFKLRWVRVSGGSSSDVVEMTCAKGTES